MIFSVEMRHSFKEFKDQARQRRQKIDEGHEITERIGSNLQN